MISALISPAKKTFDPINEVRRAAVSSSIVTGAAFPSRILVVVADESRFEQLRSLCLASGHRSRVHWLAHYETARDALVREDYDVAVLDIHHHGFRLLGDMADAGSDLPVVMLTDVALASPNPSGVICEYATHDRLDVGRMGKALRSVVRRATANRTHTRSRAWWRSEGPKSLPILASESEPRANLITFATTETAPMFDSGLRRNDLVPLPALAESPAVNRGGLLQEMLDHLPIIAAQIDEDGTILDCDGSGLKSLHLTSAELRGRNVFHFPEFPEAAIRQAMGGTPATVVRSWACEGGTRHFECHFRFDTSRQRGAVGFAYDITDRVEAERACARQKQMLAGVLRHLPVFVGRFDAEGIIREVGGTGGNDAGLSVADLEGTPFGDIFPEGRRAAAAALAGQPGHFESCLHAGTAQERHYELHLSCDDQNNGGGVFYGQDVTRCRNLEHELLHAVDAERQRLGADLHDEVGQLLTGITCLSTALAQRLQGSHDLAAEEAMTIVAVAQEALAQTRALARGLAPVRLAQHGLTDSLENLRTQVQRMHEVDLRLHLPETPLVVDDEHTAHLFRIAQEAITNAVRHGEATAIDVTLDQGHEGHRLTITDNGRGFDPHQPGKSAGSGLGLMEYRAALIGGRLHVSSGPATGTRIEVCFTPTHTYPHETAC